MNFEKNALISVIQYKLKKNVFELECMDKKYLTKFWKLSEFDLLVGIELI